MHRSQHRESRKICFKRKNKTKPKKKFLSSLPDKEFKIMVLKMFTKLGRRKKYKKLPNGSHRAEEYKTKLKNSLEGVSSRLYEAEEMMRNSKTGQWNSPHQSSRKKKKIRELRDITGPTFTLRGSQKEKGAEKLFEKVIAENFPNLVKKTDNQIEETERFPNIMNPRRLTPRHIIIICQKLKRKES